MVRLEGAVEIRAPTQVVWRFVSDLRRYPEWVAGTEAMLEMPEGPLGLWAAYRERGGFGPHPGTSEWRVVEFARPVRQVHRGVQGMTITTIGMELGSIDGGTRLTLEVEQRLHPLMRIAEILLSPSMRRKCQAALDETMATLKRIIESEEEPT